jgi:hypothetical protein
MKFSVGWLSLLFAIAVSSGAPSCAVNDTLPGSGGGGPSGPSATKKCEDMCVPVHPVGEPEYRVLRECVLCGACADACRGSDDGACVNGATEAATCSAMAGNDCAACVASACVLDQLPDTTFVGVCAPFAAACAANIECVVLNNCISECVAMGVGGGGPGTGGMPGVGGN